MLPFHILTMRKFHKVRHDYYSARSLVGAPTFAVEEEIDWNANAQRRIIEALNSEQPNA